MLAKADDFCRAMHAMQARLIAVMRCLSVRPLAKPF